MIKNLAKFFCMMPLLLGVAGASISTVKGVALANISEVMGVG